MNLGDSVRRSNSWHWLVVVVALSAAGSVFMPTYGWKDALAYRKSSLEPRIKDNQAKLDALKALDEAEALAADKGQEDILELYKTVERIAPDVFHEVKKNDKIVCANVDFYSGFAYQLLGIPEELFTPLFAIARIAGWSAHRLEEIINGNRIIRPAYKAVQPHQTYLPLADRPVAPKTEPSEEES